MARTIAIATDLRRVVAEIVAPWSAADLYAAGSADLVLERVARASTRARVHGSGAGLVAAAAGSYAAGLPLRIALQPSAAARLHVIAPAQLPSGLYLPNMAYRALPAPESEAL